MAINNYAVRPLAHDAVRANAVATRAAHWDPAGIEAVQARIVAKNAMSALLEALGMAADTDPATGIAAAWRVLDRQI